METFGGIFLVVSVVLFFVALVGAVVPRWVKQPNRKGVLLKILLPSVIFFGVGGALMPTPEKPNGQGQAELQTAQETEERRVAAEAVSKPAAKTVQEPVSKPVPEPEPATSGGQGQL